MTPFLQVPKRVKRYNHFFMAMMVSIASINLAANELDTLQFRASINKIYDSNLFRQNANEVSDQATISTLGVRFDKTYALQRLTADIYYIDNKYQDSEFLNYGATNYNAAWLWSLTPNLTGVLSSTRTQRQISFRDLSTAIKNVSTTTENTFKAEYAPYKVLTLIAGFSDLTIENSQQFNAIAGNQRVGVDYGARYNFASGSYVSVIGHRRNGTVKGRQLNATLQFDTGFTDYEYDFEFSVAENGKSSITGKLGYLERVHDNFSLRDYEGYVGNLNYELLLTGKLKSNLGVSRNVSAFETINTTYSVTDAFSASMSYDVSEKVQAGVNLRVYEREFEGRGQFDTSGRIDRERSFGASIAWKPIRNIGFSLTSTKSYRNSTLAQFDFVDTLTSINVDLKI